MVRETALRFQSVVLNRKDGEEWLASLYEKGGYACCPRTLQEILGLELGSFLSFLIDWFRMHCVDGETGKAEGDGFFYCTTNSCQENLNITARVRKRLLLNLVKLKLLEVKTQKGAKNTQLLRFRWQEISALVKKSASNAKPKTKYPKEIQKLREMTYCLYLETDHWKKVRLLAMKRAKFRCQLCNSSGELNVHHRTYENRGCERPEDLTVLCRACHEKFHDVLPTPKE